MIARSAMATTLSRPKAVSWERTSPLSRALLLCQELEQGVAQAGEGRRGQRQLGDLLASGLQQPGMVEEGDDQQGLARRQR